MLRKNKKLIKYIILLLLHYAKFYQLFLIPSVRYSSENPLKKSSLTTVIDFSYLFFILRIIPTKYYLFQFDVKDRKQFKEYMDDPSSALLRGQLYERLWDNHYTSLVDDKYIFHCHCRYHGIPVPNLYGLVRNRSYFELDSKAEEILKDSNIKNIVLKPARGIQGKGVTIAPKENLNRIINQQVSEPLLIQEVIKQHSDLHLLNPNSVNTVRILTLLTRDMDVAVLMAILRTSGDKSPVDNFCTGGVVIGIDLKTGTLKRHGFQRPEFGTKTVRHPLTRIEFHHFQVPHWQEIKKIATHAQKIFFQLKSVGWDFAICEDGPVLIEGNVEWGTAGIQAANEGLLTPANRALLAQHGLHFPT